MRYLALYDCADDEEAHRVKRAIRDFMRGDPETHSERGILLHHLLNHCLTERVGFTLEFFPAESRYVVKRRP